MSDHEECPILDNIPLEEKISEIREHTIYHIPGVKVGCTVNFECRKKEYKEGTVFYILEVIECTAQVAGDREWYWADRLGYERGRHYAEFNWNVNMTSEQRSEAGKLGGPAGVASQLASGTHVSKTRTPEEQKRISSIAGSSPNSGYKSGAAGRVGGRRQAELGMTPFQNFTKEQYTAYAKLGGVKGGRRTAELGNGAFHNGAAGRAAAKSPLSVNNQVKACPICDKKVRGPGITNHIRACEKKKS
jgi:hypothetical protein